MLSTFGNSSVRRRDSAVSQFFGRASAQEKEADVMREMRLSALRDRIVIVDRDTGAHVNRAARIIKIQE